MGKVRAGREKRLRIEAATANTKKSSILIVDLDNPNSIFNEIAQSVANERRKREELKTNSAYLASKRYRILKSRLNTNKESNEVFPQISTLVLYKPIDIVQEEKTINELSISQKNKIIDIFDEREIP